MAKPPIEVLRGSVAPDHCAILAKCEILPTPADRPEADVVLYDNRCEMCVNTVRLLARLDNGKRLAYLGVDDPEVERRWPELDRDDLLEEIVFEMRAQLLDAEDFLTSGNAA